MPGADQGGASQVFDDGSFSEDSTFQLTDWMAHVPKEVLAKNFQVDASASGDPKGSRVHFRETSEIVGHERLVLCRRLCKRHVGSGWWNCHSLYMNMVVDGCEWV